MGIAEEIVNIANSHPDPDVIRWGDVTSISPFEVRFAGDIGDTGIELRLNGYSPTTNDRVMMLNVGSRWVVIDKVVSA